MIWPWTKIAALELRNSILEQQIDEIVASHNHLADELEVFRDRRDRKLRKRREAYGRKKRGIVV